MTPLGPANRGQHRSAAGHEYQRKAQEQEEGCEKDRDIGRPGITKCSEGKMTAFPNHPSRKKDKRASRDSVGSHIGADCSKMAPLLPENLCLARRRNIHE